MGLRTWLRPVVSRSCTGEAVSDEGASNAARLRTDGGERRDREESVDEAAGNEADGNERDGTDEDETDANGSAETEPAEPTWDRVDPDDIPEFEIRADRPAGVGGSTTDASADDRVTDPTASGRADDLTPGDQADDPTAGRPNTARSPGHSRIKQGGTEGYIVALELCARLPDDIRLPEEAADLVPAAVEAELEQDIRAFAAAEFDTATPSVETLSFVEADDEIWMRLRLGISPDAFADLDPDEIRDHALERLEGVF